MHEAEPIPREDMVALAELLATAGLKESKMILCLCFDVRRMTLALPLNKHAVWGRDIEMMTKKRETCYFEFDTCIGRLGNVGLSLCPIYHFLDRLRELQRRVKNREISRINKTCIKYLMLMLYSLDVAKEGVDLKLLTY